MSFPISNRLGLGGIALSLALAVSSGSASAVEIVSLDCGVPLGQPSLTCGGSPINAPLAGSMDSGVAWDLVLADMHHLVPPPNPFELELDFEFSAFSPFGASISPFAITSVLLTDVGGDLATSSVVTGPVDDITNEDGTSTWIASFDTITSAGFIHDFHVSCDPVTPAGVPVTPQTCQDIDLVGYRFASAEDPFVEGIWAMPEPGSIALLGLGLVATGAVARRRRGA